MKWKVRGSGHAGTCSRLACVVAFYFISDWPKNAAQGGQDA